ncbi:MAG TPA: acyl-CoA thioesterase [Lachnospiraceae bacterium]|nr:acyl-CoA thioesterase [Lachnospiraceae bacterium]
MNMKAYKHKVQYYETDQMKIVHHSNYIRWFEEARIDYMDQIGISYPAMEKEGILIPVLSVEAKYLRMLRFGDVAEIVLGIKEYNGIKLVIEYQVMNEKTGMIHCKGETAHCFLTEQGKPVSLKKNYPEYHKKFVQMAEDNMQSQTENE